MYHARMLLVSAREDFTGDGRNTTDEIRALIDHTV